MNRVKGFTIFEMLIVMVVSSIAVTLSILIWLNLQKFFSKISKESETRTEILLLKDQLREDLKTAQALHMEADGFRLSNSTEDISYRVADDYLVRESEMGTDTFKVKILEIESTPTKENSKLQKDVSLIVWGEGIQIPISISIKYDSKTLLKSQ